MPRPGRARDGPAGPGPFGRLTRAGPLPGDVVPEAENHTIATALGLLAVCSLIVVTGVFVAAEFALVAADRARIDRAAEQGGRRARLVRTLLRRLSFHLSGAQLGITIASLVLGILAEPTIAALLAPLLEPVLGDGATHAVSVVLALILATYLEMVLGELVPKNLAIAAPERAALLLAPFLRVYGLVFGPIISILNHAANWLVRRFGIEPSEEMSAVRTLSELSLLVEASKEEGTINDSATRLLSRSIRFGRKTAADVLVPRVEMDAIGRDAPVSELVDLAGRSGHSRFPVFGADLDDIVGVAHVKSVHALSADERRSTLVEQLMDEIPAVPETRELHELLEDMRERRNHLVIVVDEYGGTSGIVTLEDLLEEIVGEIDDEYDPLTPRLTQAVGAGEFVVSGALHPDEVEEATGFTVPEGEYETLAGFVLDRLGHLPESGEAFAFDGWHIEVVLMDRRRVAQVRLRRESEGVDDGDGTPPPGRADGDRAVPPPDGPDRVRAEGERRAGS